jgi:thioredoxin-like negative regulator of GroEL
VQLVGARTLVDVGRIDEATHLVDRLEKVQLETTDRATVLFLRGHIAERGKDRMNALTFYEQALAIDPTRADAAANAISVLLGDGSPTAFAKIEQILAKVPASHRSRPELVFNQAIYLVRSGKPAEGKAQLERLVAALPGDHPLGHLAKQAVLELSKTK